MTLVQAGLDEMKAAKGGVEKPAGPMSKSPDQIVKARGEDDSQGLLGFLKTIDKKFSIIYDESTDSGLFRSRMNRRSPVRLPRTARKTGRNVIRDTGKAWYRSNACRPRAEHAGSAFSGAAKSSRPSSVANAVQ